MLNVFDLLCTAFKISDSLADFHERNNLLYEPDRPNTIEIRDLSKESKQLKEDDWSVQLEWPRRTCCAYNQAVGKIKYRDGLSYLFYFYFTEIPLYIPM